MRALRLLHNGSASDKRARDLRCPMIKRIFVVRGTTTAALEFSDARGTETGEKLDDK